MYYTPPELVAYLVRATEHVLQREFGLEHGLADRSVILLDPALGTGTFVLGMAERALDTEAPRGTASQRHPLREHLLHNFSGFELLPAPYATAHLKLASFYQQFGSWDSKLMTEWHNRYGGAGVMVYEVARAFRDGDDAAARFELCKLADESLLLSRQTPLPLDDRLALRQRIAAAKDRGKRER